MNDSKLMSILQKVSNIQKSTQSLSTILSEELYEQYLSPIVISTEDLLFYTLFGYDYFTLHDMFSTPGDIKKNKVILWDKQKGGYPPERLLDLTASNSLNFKEIKRQIILIKKALKEHQKNRNNDKS